MELNATNKNFCPPEHFNSCFAALYKRGLIDLKKYTLKGKELMSVYLTKDGINFLDYMERNKKNIDNNFR